jgi:hypothetical protein
MTTAATEPTEDTSSVSRWSLLAVGGAVSLCCLFAAPATMGAVGTSAAGGSTVAPTDGLVQIVVSIAAVGILGLVLRLRTGLRSFSK